MAERAEFGENDDLIESFAGSPRYRRRSHSPGRSKHHCTIGTVQSIDLVSIEAQVNGPIIKIEFRAGPGCQERSRIVPDRSAPIPGSA